MSGATLVLGGARSGKSKFAETLATDSGLALHYIATAQAYDDEMRARISVHRERRANLWQTHDAPIELVATLKALSDPQNVVLIDCLTLWVTNLMMRDADIVAAFDALCAEISQNQAKLIFVSNEVGMGIVPENAMARAFRDHAGRLHQRIAGIATHVYFVAASLPLKMKG